MKKAGHISNNAGCRTDTQRWLSGGKELLTEFRLNEYDFEARRLVPLTGRFTQPDPLAGKYPWFSPYAYCGADPVNFIDPTGCFVLNNEKELVRSNVLYVCPNITFLDCMGKEKDNAKVILYRSRKFAQDSGIPILRVENMEDLRNGLAQCLPGSNITTVVITSHGSPDSFSIGKERVTAENDFKSLRTDLKGKVIVVNACNVGANDETPLTEKMAEDLQAVVITSAHTMPSYNPFDDSNMMNETEPPFKPKERPNEYKLSNKGHKSQTIYNLRIGKLSGARWSTGNYLLPHETLQPFSPCSYR